MKLHFKIKNPAHAYAIGLVAVVAALIGFELLFRVVSVDEILIQVLIFTVLDAVGIYRNVKRLDND